MCLDILLNQLILCTQTGVQHVVHLSRSFILLTSCSPGMFVRCSKKKTTVFSVCATFSCIVTLQQKEHPSNRSDPPLQKVVFPSDFGTLHPRESRHNSQGPKHDRCNHERPGALNVPCRGNDNERYTRPSSPVSQALNQISSSVLLKTPRPF